MSLTTPYKEQFLEANGTRVDFPFNDHGDGFDAISKNYVKCEVYNADGSIIVPDFTVDLSAKTITITSLTTPDGQILNAPQNGAVVRIYRDVPETQNTTAQALQQATAQQIVQNFDNIVAMIQELRYANEHFTLRSTLPQRDLKIDLLRDIDDQKLVYWDNKKRKLVVTNYRQDELLLPSDKEDILGQANAYSDEQNSVLESRIDGKLTAVESQIDANADAIQKTREDYISADSEIHQILNSHTGELTALRGNQASLGDQVSGIEEKIATKQDQLVAGDNIVISGNTISATGAGGGAGLDMVVVDQLPETGQKGILYLVKKDGAAPDIHDEYVWIESTQSFELIGTTQVDLSGYAKKTYVDSADQQLKANQDSLYANQVVLSGMLNTKDADGNWTALTTSAQAAIPAINELNEKIESAGDASLPEQADIENSKFYNIPLFDGTKLLINNSLRFRWFEHQNGGTLSFSKTNTSLGSGSLCVGINSVISGYTGQTAIGHHAKTSAAGATAIGWAQVSAECAVHIGSNYLSATNVPDNSVRGSFMWTNNDGSYLLFNRDGTIPAERMSATAGTTGQVLTKTDTGMAWQDVAGGGGTKVIIKRYS